LGVIMPLERRTGPVIVTRGAESAGGGFFSSSFTSANQTITAAGSLTLAHGLGTVPSFVQSRIKNTTAELGYSIGDELIVNPHNTDANGGAARGSSNVPDATNLNIRYGSNSNTFNILRKDTGASANITNSSWVAIFKAWV
jgi:hypothetical protein